MHEGLAVTESGLVINPQWPFIAASPDGVISCKCHEKGVLEIKFPYTHRNEGVEAAACNDSNFCLQEHEGTLRLDRNHAYYYQVQTQMFVCDVTYCEFCVCTFPSHLNDSAVFVEWITRDENLWNTILQKSKQFFITCLLLEILGNWYTQPAPATIAIPSSSQSTDNDMDNATVSTVTDNQKLYCYYQGPEEGSMVGCDNSDCKYEWFHFSCLKLSTVPKGKWYCPDYRILPQFLKRKGKGKKTY